MSNDTSLLHDLETHFAFGKNWKSYASRIDEDCIRAAMEKMRLLLGRDSLEGLSFVDIGCGSGIHSLAALRLGARTVCAFDFDPVSVETCRHLLSQKAASSNWNCRVANVFNLPQELSDPFDVAYSWGVLHHTGDMWTAIHKASMLSAHNGLFALALYYKTPLCGFWKIEKQFYSRLPPLVQFPICRLFGIVDLFRLMLRGQNPFTFVKNYHVKRGMSFWHDLHDWLGGYPYESASAEEVVSFVEKLGFEMVHTFGAQRSLGLTGTGCAEYLFRRKTREHSKRV